MRDIQKTPIARAFAGVAALAAALLVSATAAGPALAAEAFPSKPVTMLVAFPPGGPADVLARAMQPSMAKIGRAHV